MPPPKSPPKPPIPPAGGSGDPIETGPGGFDVDGRLYSYDVGLPEANGGDQGSYESGVDVSAGYVDSNGKPKDLTKKTKTTLSQYLSKQTNGQGAAVSVPNRYPIDGQYDETDLRTKAGNPALQTPGGVQPHNNAAFAPDVDKLSAMSDNYPKISQQINKGRADKTGIDGNDLLLGVPGDGAQPLNGHQDTTDVIKPYVSAVMSANRFSDATNSWQAVAHSDSTGFVPSLLPQTTLGRFDPGAPTISTSRLAKVGPLLTMRAGRELGAASAGTDPNSGGEMAAALLPGLAQLGVSRVDAAVLLAADVINGLTNEEINSDTFVLKIQDNSWGQLNNVNDPFSGMDALGMLALSTALVAGLELLIDGLSLLLGLITPQVKKPARDAQGRYSLGEYFQGTKSGNKKSSGGLGGAISALASLDFGSLLGIQPTNYPFSAALKKGSNAFFGIDDSGGILGQLAGALTSSTDSPGFNAVVARAIIRSGITIIDKMKKIGGNLMNAVNQILSLIDVIRSSKLIAACNIFAMLGDALLTKVDDEIDPDTSKTKVSSVDAKSDTYNVVGKNRLKGTLKLAWASNRAPAQVLLPSNVFAASLQSKNMGQFSTDMGLRKDPYSLVQSKVVAPKAGGRISTEDALAFEDELEASYVPFYFHDLRTNEIVSFHAFLAALTDDYTAQWEKTEGIGRVEPVKIYKGTERRITMSFYIVATSPIDFDEMYIKINKLVTLVYPQYTAGVQVQDAADSPKYVFTQPFSQLVGSSPIIRIRLGDLLRSNYSLFALGRLFGMADASFTANGKQLTGVDGIDQGAIDAYETKIQQLLKDPAGKTFQPDWNRSYEYVDDSGSSGGGVSVKIGGGGDQGPKFAPEFDPFVSDYKGCFIVKVKKLDPDNPYQVIGEVAFNDDPLYVNNTSNIKQYVDDNFSNDKKPLKKFIGGTYKFPINCLIPTRQTISDIVANVPALQSLTPDSEYGTAIADFMNPAKNAIAKSFQDTGGRGLAGTIESMNFDWYDKVTWEIDHNRTAPKMCKVTINFSPIHDISPGIDSYGFNRAPVYPVGAMAQGQMPYQKTNG